MNGIDIAELERLGRLKQADAQSLHEKLCRKTGAERFDEIVGFWNKMSPEAPWDCPLNQAHGAYYDQLTQIVLGFMAHKVEEARKKSSKID